MTSDRYTAKSTINRDGVQLAATASNFAAYRLVLQRASRLVPLRGTAIAALTVLISLSAQPAVLAQGVSLLPQGDDSLLPPEVVPLDPATAISMGQPQAASTPTTMGSSVPGLVDNNAANNNMQSAQDFRKTAFSSLYNQGQVPQQQPLGQWRAGQASQGQGQLGQSPMANPNGGESSAAVANTPPTQSQTLSGGTKHHQKLRDIRRGGLSNILSAAGAFGAGAMMGGFFIRPNSPLMGAGMWGLMSTGFGSRNAFRF